ncbi:hypothetical protein H257_00826 [Aphanomyces astaci]|uniref:MATE efflux family protein n=2 Tax=Aphanomyces astaci TaxID=112090 RepID=W4HCI4_APHAT|nr:hypothetical protein H257_00826 [Aphanomyces astaci]ETV89617.1 hypothetical protein H257_00826 [Aphanomyces astaci]RQM27035.1 hypothetical protein B5M09_005967 [Aphanomyces astaci]|eukprot:XP_009822017.1 hypothetical protein H257_00826 [Aphanomyces astaci]
MAAEKSPLLKGGAPSVELKQARDPLQKHARQAKVPLGQETLDVASMALQISLRQMVRQVMTITDAAFLGHIGTKQLAGVALAGMWMGVPSAFVQFSIQAISTLCSQAYGAGNHDLVGVWLQTAIVFSVLGSIPVMIWYMYVGNMIALTMDDAETVAYGREFAHVMALGLIPQYVYGALTAYFAAQGIIMPATICSIVTMGLNIVLNQVLIHGVDGQWGGLGFVGSPLATVASTVLQLALFLLYTVVWKGYHTPTWGTGWTWECVKKDRLDVFLALAIPMGASAVVDWASATVAGAFSGYLGPNIAACQAVLNGLFGVVSAFVSGFATATQIRMSRYLGQGSAGNAKRVYFIGAGLVFVSAVVLLAVVVTCRRLLFGIWSSDVVVADMASDAIAAFSLCILVAFGRFLLTACMNAVSKADLNLVANNIASWLVFVPLSYVFPIRLGWGLAGFWWADALGELLKASILLYDMASLDWHAAADEAQLAAETSLANDYGDEDEHRELNAAKNEALLFTPRSFKSPSINMTMTPPVTPNDMRRAIGRSRSAANPNM